MSQLSGSAGPFIRRAAGTDHVRSRSEVHRCGDLPPRSARPRAEAWKRQARVGAGVACPQRGSVRQAAVRLFGGGEPTWPDPEQQPGSLSLTKAQPSQVSGIGPFAPGFTTCTCARTGKGPGGPPNGQRGSPSTPQMHKLGARCCFRELITRPSESPVKPDLGLLPLGDPCSGAFPKGQRPSRDWVLLTTTMATLVSFWGLPLCSHAFKAWNSSGAAHNALEVALPVSPYYR